MLYKLQLHQKTEKDTLMRTIEVSTMLNEYQLGQNGRMNGELVSETLPLVRTLMRCRLLNKARKHLFYLIIIIVIVQPGYQDADRNDIIVVV